MSDTELQRQLTEARQAIRELQRELEETNKGIIALNLELEQKLDQIEASEARYTSLVATVPDIIYRIDKEGKFTFLNKAIKMLGYTEAELIGKHFSEIVIAEEAKSASRAQVLHRYKGKITGDEGAPKLFDERRTGARRTSGLEIRLIAKERNGTMPAVLHSIGTENIPVEINSSGIYETDPDTKQKLFVGTVGVIRDIRERAKAEKELRKAYNEVKTINKELEAFSYSVSHDLRAPLRSIDGFSAALLEDYVDVLNEQGKNYLQRVRAATQRMGKLIDDMLMLSRVTRSKMKYEQINLSHLAQTIINELREEEPQRKVKAVIEKDLLVNGDISLLRIMLGNLLHNAWKFTGNNPTARIEFQTIEQEGKQVYLIRDNGVGFEMTYSDKLFVAFQRLHPEGEFPGTGIGLATVQRIINRHGGRVWAEGKVGNGATFYFTLESD